jgi:hypothetical protein
MLNFKQIQYCHLIVVVRDSMTLRRYKRYTRDDYDYDDAHKIYRVGVYNMACTYTCMHAIILLLAIDFFLGIIYIIN